MSPQPSAEARIRILLAELETRSRRGPGLYPVREAGDFLLLVARHLGFPPVTPETLPDLAARDLTALAGALDTLRREPAEAAVWLNRLCLQHSAWVPRALPAGARRSDAALPADVLAAVLHGENTCPSPALRSAS